MKTLITLALTITALFAATAHAIIITGQHGYTVTAYGNPFIGSNNSIGVISGGGSIAEGLPAGAIANVVSQQDAANGGTGAWGRIQGPTATSGFMQFIAQTPFTAGTVISSQFVHPLFNTPMTYNILLDGNIVQSAPGTPGTAAITVTTLASKQTVQTLRVNEAMSTFNGTTGTHYGDMSEVLILPDRLGVVPSTASATGTVAGSAAGVNDLKGGGNYWIGGHGSSVTLTFSGTKPIAALVLANLENVPDSSDPLTFNILNDAGTIVANGSMSENGSVGEFVGIDFNTPVVTSFLTLDFTNAGNASMLEMIPLEAPEPASMGLLAVGGVMLLKRRR